MKMANVSTIKNNLSQFLNYVKKGGTVRIVDRQTPIGDIVPIAAGSQSSTTILDQLVSQGLIGRKKKSLPKSFFCLAGTSSSGVLESLLKERNDDR